MTSDAIIALQQTLAQLNSQLANPKPDNDNWRAGVYQSAKSLAEIAGVPTHASGKELQRTCRQLSELLEDAQRTNSRLETRLGKQRAEFDQLLAAATGPEFQPGDVVVVDAPPIDETNSLDDETVEIAPLPTPNS